MYGEWTHEQHVRRTLTLTLTHTITAYSVSGNVVHVRILIVQLDKSRVEKEFTEGRFIGRDLGDHAVPGQRMSPTIWPLMTYAATLHEAGDTIHNWSYRSCWPCIVLLLYLSIIYGNNEIFKKRSFNNKKKKKIIYNAHIVKHQAWIRGAGSHQAVARAVTSLTNVVRFSEFFHEIGIWDWVEVGLSHWSAWSSKEP